MPKLIVFPKGNKATLGALDSNFQDFIFAIAKIGAASDLFAVGQPLAPARPASSPAARTHLT